MVGKDDHLIRDAAIAGGVAGFTLLGPDMGAVAADGFAYSAAYDAVTNGDISRVTGETTIRLVEKTKEFERENHLLEKTGGAIHVGLEKGNSYNNEHHVSEKITHTAQKCIKKAVEYEKEKHVLEKATNLAQTGLEKANAYTNEHHVLENAVNYGPYKRRTS